MNSTETSGQFAILRSLKPLEFDPALACDYLQSFSSHEKKQEVLGELESLYDGMLGLQERFETLDAIGDTNIFFDDMEEEEGQDDEEL